MNCSKTLFLLAPSFNAREHRGWQDQDLKWHGINQKLPLREPTPDVPWKQSVQHQRCRDHRCRRLGAKPKSAVNSEVCVSTLMTLEAGAWAPFLGMVLPALTQGLEPERPVGLVICPPVKERSRGFGSETPGRWKPVSDKISEPLGSGMHIREPVAGVKS